MASGKSIVLYLKSGKVPDQLEDPQDAHHPHEPDNLSGFADDLDVLEAVEEERQVEGDDGQEVDQVHRLLEELPLPGRAQKPDNVLLRVKRIFFSQSSQIFLCFASQMLSLDFT